MSNHHNSHDSRPKMQLTPYVIEDTGRGERSMDIFSRLLKDRIIFLGQDITDVVANVIVAQMLFLKTEDSKKDIHLYINCLGGYINAGLAIYDLMQWLPCKVSTYCIGQASSMGSLLLAAGTRGRRFALPNSRIMIHQPSGGIGGSAAEMAIQAKEILKMKTLTNKIIAQHTGESVEKVALFSERDYYMSPEEAKAFGEHGIIDEIIVPSQVHSQPVAT